MSEQFHFAGLDLKEVQVPGFTMHTQTKRTRMFKIENLDIPSYAITARDALGTDERREVGRFRIYNIYLLISAEIGENNNNYCWTTDNKVLYDIYDTSVSVGGHTYQIRSPRIGDGSGRRDWNASVDYEQKTNYTGWIQTHLSSIHWAHGFFNPAAGCKRFFKDAPLDKCLENAEEKLKISYIRDQLERNLGETARDVFNAIVSSIEEKYADRFGSYFDATTQRVVKSVTNVDFDRDLDMVGRISLTPAGFAQVCKVCADTERKELFETWKKYCTESFRQEIKKREKMSSVSIYVPVIRPWSFEAYCAIHDRQVQEDFTAAEEIAKQLAKDTGKEFNDEPILYSTGYSND